MSTADLPKREAPDSLMLTGFWYRALPSEQVGAARSSKAMLLEMPLVIGRDRNGQPFALRDACPHRGMPLSCGRFDGEQVECSYHGWKFEAQSGQCQADSFAHCGSESESGSHLCRELCLRRARWLYLGFIPDPGPAGAGFTRRDEPGSPAPQVPTFSEKYQDCVSQRGLCRAAWTTESLG